MGILKKENPKTVVITGGTRGLGLEMAKQFRKRDYHVVICGTSDSSVEKALETLKKMNSKGSVCGMPCNVADPESLRELASFAVAQYGAIDIWINNAGINQSRAFAWDLSDEEISRIIDVDLKGTIYGCKAVIPIMEQQGYGAIYNMEGLGSNDQHQTYFTMYGTGKRAVTYFTNGLVHEMKEKNSPLQICLLSPGMILTDFLTSANGGIHNMELTEDTKRIYNILGDKPEVIATYLVRRMASNTKTGCRISWLTGPKVMRRFMLARFRKRDFFTE